MLGKLGQIPKLHDTLDTDGLRLRVEAMDGMRIARISLKRLI
jgi:CBS domain containing-hemolysin-like protein